MSSKKPELPEPTFDFDAAYAELADSMHALHISRVAEMPKIELYLDQLLSLVEMELAFMYAPGERIVTGAMVNNYVKQHLLPPPTRKRYTRRHLASLLFVCAFKRVLTIAQVAQLRAMCAAASVDIERAYDEIIGELERTLAARFGATPNDAPATHDLAIALCAADGTPITGELAHLFEGSVALLANRIYIDHLLALETRRGDGGETHGDGA